MTGYKKRCDHCGAKGLQRCSMGPTGHRKVWMIAVDRCTRCSSKYPTPGLELTWEQQSWVERCNRRSREHYDKEEAERKPGPVFGPPQITSTASVCGPWHTSCNCRLAPSP